MSLISFDAAYPPSVDAMRAAGATAVCVYTDGGHAWAPAMIQEAHDKGLGVLFNHENAEGELLGGYAAGQGAAQRALASAQVRLAPADGTVGIAYSVDLNVAPADFPAVGSAFDGINQVHAGRYQAHVYGEGALIDYLVQTGRVVGAQWLSESSSFPGWNPSSPNVGLVQRYGASPLPSCDLNEITQPTRLGIWWPPGSPYSTAAVVPKGAGMFLIYDQDAKAYAGYLPSGKPIGVLPQDMPAWKASGVPVYGYPHLMYVGVKGNLDAAWQSATVAANAAVAASATLNDPHAGVGVRVADLQAKAVEQAAQVAALQAALTAVSTANGFDPAAVQAAAEKGAQAALATLELTVTPKVVTP